jgi:hypothetical protein
VTAKGDDLAFLVPAVGITAVAVLQLDEREMAGLDFDAAERRALDLPESRRTPEKIQRPEVVGRLSLPELRQPDLSRPRRRLGPFRLCQTHPPRPSEGGAAGIRGAESRIDGVSGVRVGQAPGDVLFQSLAMRARPVFWFHLSCFRFFSLAATLPSITLFRKQGQAILLKTGIDFLYEIRNRLKIVEGNRHA